jgi:hypothetical protein
MQSSESPGADAPIQWTEILDRKLSWQCGLNACDKSRATQYNVCRENPHAQQKEHHSKLFSLGVNYFSDTWKEEMFGEYPCGLRCGKAHRALP